MSIIKILPENLVNQIAAGEVIERPASVVKELIENSIDALADKIIIEVKDGGKTFIKISDNGIGMDSEDLQLAIKRHATSKIFQESDLWNIKTMGFRGEALSSIASVSKMVIKSKKEHLISGCQIECNAEDLVTMRDTAMDRGTTVEVYDLFFNTPARQKYLKNENTELSYVTSAITNIALANEKIAFKYIHNGNVIFDLPKVTDLISRISDIFGKNTADAMIPVFYGGTEFQINGFVGKPVLSRSSSKHQYFFVNNRYIQHHILANTIKSAFHSMLMENKKPVFIINIKIDPALIDVNVHPRKIEVRFEDQQAIIKSMYNCVKAALEKNNLIPKAFTESRHYMSNKFPNEFSNEKPSANSVQDALDFSKEMLQQREIRTLNNLHDSNTNVADSFILKPLSQVSNSYIVAQNDKELILIDQHAAHERVRYEQLMDQFENEKKSIQPLLVPSQIEFAYEEISIIKENKEIFDNLGFEIEHFGGNTYLIHAVPSFLAKEDLEQVIKGVLDDIVNEKSPTKFQGKTEEIINYMACRSAIKFGQKLTIDEMQSLIWQVEKLKRPYTCPHGRPTMISLTLDELEKMFGRK